MYVKPFLICFIGLEGSSQVVKSLVAAGMPPLFSFYLTPQSVGNAELTLGGIDHTKYKGDLITLHSSPA